MTVQVPVGNLWYCEELADSYTKNVEEIPEMRRETVGLVRKAVVERRANQLLTTLPRQRRLNWSCPFAV